MKKTNQKELGVNINDIFEDKYIKGNKIVLNEGESTTEGIFNINKELRIKNKLEYNLNKYTTHYVADYTLQKLLVLTGDTEHFQLESSDTFPLFFESSFERYIPNKIKRTIERNISDKRLKTIHPDKETAIELCLLFVSNLSNAFYENKGGWKTLYSKILREQFGYFNSKDLYLKVFELLSEGTLSVPIFERSTTYAIGQ